MFFEVEIKDCPPAYLSVHVKDEVLEKYGKTTEKVLRLIKANGQYATGHSVGEGDVIRLYGKRYMVTARGFEEMVESKR